MNYKQLAKRWQGTSERTPLERGRVYRIDAAGQLSSFSYCPAGTIEIENSDCFNRYKVLSLTHSGGAIHLESDSILEIRYPLGDLLVLEKSETSRVSTLDKIKRS